MQSDHLLPLVPDMLPQVCANDKEPNGWNLGRRVYRASTGTGSFETSWTRSPATSFASPNNIIVGGA